MLHDLWSDLRFRLRAVFRRASLERELDEELRLHLELEARKLQRGGAPHADALRRARLSVGGIEQLKESVRDARGVSWFDDGLRDVRYALRSLRRAPGFSMVVVATLALGIGATTAIFTVFHAVLLRPLPYPDADRIISVTESQKGQDHGMAAAPDYFAWRESVKSFSSLALYSPLRGTMIDGPEPVQVSGAAVSSDFFSVLGVTPEIGRSFRPEDNGAGGAQVAIISHALWERAFGSDSAALGRSLVFEDKTYTVIGVMGPKFEMPRRAAYWTPSTLAPGGNPKITWYVSVVGRLRAGATVESARAELTAAMRQLDESRPAAVASVFRGTEVVVLSLHDRMFGPARPALIMLLGAAGFLLLIACVNVANLLIARSATRRRELAVRLALGAARRHLVRQLLAESLLLALLGGVLGLTIPVWGVALFVRLSPATVANVNDIHVDGAVLLFAAAAAVVTGVLFGIGPAFVGGGRDVFASLKQGASGVMGSVRQQFVRGVLVMTEMATALVLLTGAALMSKSLANALAVNSGFHPEGLTAMTVYLTRARYPDATAARAFFQRLEERVSGLPGVESVALTDETPFEGFNPGFNARVKPGEPATLPLAATDASASYGRVVGLQLVEGRLFDETDRGLSAPSVLLSESAAQAFFPDGPAVGRRLPPMNSWPVADAIVVGVVKNVPQPGVDVTPIPRMYFSLDQSQIVPTTILVRSSGDPVQLASAVRHAVHEIDPLQFIFSVRTTESEVAKAVAPRRLNATILSVFACLALVLAAVGLYGVVAYQVAQRTREIGLRIALGAEGVRVLSLVVRQGMRFAAAGAIVGVALSYVLARFLSGMLFAVSVHDAAMFAAAPAALLAVAIVACYLPARRAARIDPMIALRAD